jgi:hypothetical protein
MSELVISGLIKRRAQLAGDIENTHEALRKMVLDLESLDATIVQFDPDFQVETIKPKAFRPPKDWSNRGQMSRIILSVLRQAAEPLTTRDIAVQLLIERALDKSDLRLLRLMTKRVGVALRGQRENGVVRCDQGPGQYILKECLGDNPQDHQHSFIAKFCTEHSDPYPPCWMLMEALSFGAVSKIYKLAKGHIRQKISVAFNLQHDVLESWLHALSTGRNVCAHHGRVWNRSFTIWPKIPRAYRDIWAAESADKLYVLCAIKLVLPGNNTMAQSCFGGGGTAIRVN